MTTIYLAKYTPDLRRGEPRNIGLVIEDESARAWRFLSPQEASGFVRDMDIYGDWLSFYEQRLGEGCVMSDLRGEPTDNYTVIQVGEVLLGSEAPDRMVADYFQKLVSKQSS